jgi:drug/metabolite transporter (DMT)-like permease
MSRRLQIVHFGVLILLGIGWGATLPLSKIAVSTGYQYFGLIFWQLVIGVLLMLAVSLLRGRRLPLHRSALRIYVVIASIGTLIPNTASYQSIVHLPSGVVSVLMSLIPIIAFPIALGLGLEKFSVRRLLGLLTGMAGMILLAQPTAGLSEPVVLKWVAVALISVCCYALEGNVVAKWGTGGVDPVGVLFGASLFGAIVMLPLAIGSGQFISPFRVWGPAEWALLLSSVTHVVVYASFIWLVGRAGPIFAIQVSYLVTISGVLWAMLLLSEQFAATFWAAMALVLAGVFLVQPRKHDTLAPDDSMGKTLSKLN